MSSSESDCTFVDKGEDEEGKIYHWIYEMMIDEDDKEEKEEVEIPSSSELEPVHTTEDERKTNDIGTQRTTLDTTGAQRQREQKVGNTEGQHKDVADDIQVKRQPKVKAEKKPWRRAGADTSDYFNYGFDEESWNDYCQKQTKLLGAHRKLNNKIEDQKGHTTHEEKHSGRGSSSRTPSIRASRQSRCTTDVTGGKPGHRRWEEHGWITDEGDNTQVVNRMSPEEETMNSYNLSSSSSISSGYEFILPQRVHSRSRPPPLRQPVTDSVLSKRLDVPSASPNQDSSGVTSLILKNTACSAGVINTADTWEYLILHDTCEEDRNREYRYDRDRKRDRERDQESCSSAHSSRKEQQRHWEPTKQGHKHHSLERNSEGKEDREKRRHRDEQGASSHRSSSRMSRSRSRKKEDRDTKRSRKRKKSKRKKKDKETARRSVLTEGGN